MGQQERSLYGLPLDDPEVSRATDILTSLSPEDRDRVLRAMMSAVFGYQRTQDSDGLRDFARDLVATVNLRANPDYEKLLNATPSASRGGPGRSVREVFERIRG